MERGMGETWERIGADNLKVAPTKATQGRSRLIGACPAGLDGVCMGLAFVGATFRLSATFESVVHRRV